jgi:transcriptional regulator with XRE-family HTH domain
MRENNLREIREARLISRAELARRTGLSVVTIERIEQGETCRLESMRKILDVLGIPVIKKELVFP